MNYLRRIKLIKHINKIRIEIDNLNPFEYRAGKEILGGKVLYSKNCFS